MRQSSSAFLRIARHLNYRRTFLARDCTRVDIPSLPFEAFDSSGTKINPWSILTLVESVRSFSFSQYATVGQPRRSTLDFHEILDTHLIFIVGATVDIKRPCHDFEGPKFPLYVIEKLKYLGKSSKTLSYEIYDCSTDTLQVSCDLTDVLVSGVSRKPVAYPAWWLQKHGDLITPEKAKLSEDPIPTGQPAVSEVKVKSGDIDTFQHTNWASYLKFCYESLTEHATDNSYEQMNIQRLTAGVKSCKLIYKDETNFGDNLTVKSWNSDSQETRVIFNVLKDKKLCMYCDIDFY
ncbi:uncharacterized protein LOC123560497 [Mercenaria mercenaria]|uniref:uncharacterized protein LOC123560497 n=1 Tax=Mercenaria mercenaria TaxID=6596 RepID=UPI00234F42B0|nr:uncharacterized protein LOC123560497 [Mercenaria mercenaria]